MTYEELRERVAGEMANAPARTCSGLPLGCDRWPVCKCQFDANADAAIRTVIEALAQEADAYYDANGDPDGPVFALDMYGNEIADWLRSYLPEATP